MTRPILATISTQNMAHNLAQLKQTVLGFSHVQRVENYTPLFYAVVKANAYGHGLAQAVTGFAQADGLAVIEIEALPRLRQLGWQKSILLLEGFFEESDLPVLVQTQATTALHSDAQLAMLEQLPEQAQLNIMVKINSGMNRLGFTPPAVAHVMQRLQALQSVGKVGTVGFMMHFANADAPLHSAQHVINAHFNTQPIEQAWQQFYQSVQAYQGQGPISVCNSAASLRYSDYLLAPGVNIYRPGICLYGSSPMMGQTQQEANQFNLKPTMSLKAKIIATQHLEKGDSVGYGSLFIAQQPMRIGVVACGYADGYPRSAPNGTPVVIAGQRSCTLGRISMDMLEVDLTHLPHVQIGEWVYLWGEGGPSIDEVALAAGRTSYEILCGLAKRVPVQIEA